MSKTSATSAELRRRTQAHYDRYPFRFDESAILDEKMKHRIMGEAIRELGSPHATICDVGCGACRVAHMIRSEDKGRAISLDVSLETLRSSKAHNPDPLINCDNMYLPLRSNTADLVISNGVIMLTPDVKASFKELARITKPGGTLVLSVYDRKSWYYPVYRYGGAVVRSVRKVIGDPGLKLTLFPVFHVAVLILMALVTRKPFWIPINVSWNLFHDQFTTPHCTFHTFKEISHWAKDAGLNCEKKAREAANQLITLKLRKPLRG